MEKNTNITAVDPESLSLIKAKHKRLTQEPTTAGEVKVRPDGMKYVDEAYLRSKLNEHFPIWSWSRGNMQFLGGEWVMVEGVLRVLDEHIWREFFSVGAARIQFKKGTEHIPVNVINIDYNAASANTNAFKRAVNRLCNIADDVYEKEIKDFSLTEAQDKELSDLIDKLPDDERDRFGDAYANRQIDSSNYDKMILIIKSKVKQ